MKKKIEDTFQIRPRYHEVDQMGYVYHANYVSYCHQARTELLRKLKLEDKILEANHIMLPVISMNLNYLKPVGYDELITIKTTLEETPVTRFHFQFEITNEQGQVVCKANSSTAMIDSITRKPMRVPEMIKKAFSDFEINTLPTKTQS